MENIAEHEYFPDKPPLPDENQANWGKSVASLMFFIIAFYFFFNRDIGFILVLVGVLLIHELGHFGAMKIFGYRDVKMFFIPLLGALVSGSKSEVSQTQRAIVVLAGPVPGIIIGIALYLFGGSEAIQTIGSIFLFINIFNLLPLTPLDGGNLIKTLFFGASDVLDKIFTIISAVALAAIALLLQSYVLLIIPFFMLSRLRGQTQLVKAKRALRLAGVDFEKEYDDLTNREYWLTRAELIKNISFFQRMEPHQYTPAPNEPQLINYVRGLGSNRMRQDMSVGLKIAFLLAWILFFALPVGAIVWLYLNTPVLAV